MSSNILLKNTSIESFMGISSEDPIVLDFTKAYSKDKNITSLQGDQGARKTSTMNALMFLLGVHFNIDMDNLINSKDNSIKAESEFECEGKKYRVKATKSRFLLEKYIESEKVWIKENEPKATLKRIIGNVGVSPMFLKEMDGTKQIEWFRKTFAPDEEISKKEIKIKQHLKEARSARTEANREYTRIKSALNSNGLYINYEQSQKEFKNVVSIEEANQKLTKATNLKNQHYIAKDKVKLIEQQIEEKQKTISELEVKLHLELSALKALEDTLQKGLDYIKENKNAEEEFNAASKEFSEINAKLLNKQTWENILIQETQMNEFESVVQNLDSKKDELKKNLLELTATYLPDIPGLEIIVAEGMDDDKEGIYFEGKSLAQLSESELWGLFFNIWEQKDVMFVFIENVSSLGTTAIDTLNSLAKKGVKVFASQMNRKQQTMKISFVDQI